MIAPDSAPQERKSSPVHAAARPPPKDWHFASNDAAAAAALRTGFGAFLRVRMTAMSDIAAAEVIFGELVANVIRHAPGAIWIDVDWTENGEARLQVSDTGPAFRSQGELPTCVLSECGRGLYLVQALAASVCIERQASGNIVTVILPVWAAQVAE